MNYSLTCCPVVDVPVIAWFINQSVVLLQLVLTHCVQVSLCKKAEREMENSFNQVFSLNGKSCLLAII